MYIFKCFISIEIFPSINCFQRYCDVNSHGVIKMYELADSIVCVCIEVKRKAMKILKTAFFTSKNQRTFFHLLSFFLSKKKHTGKFH